MQALFQGKCLNVSLGFRWVIVISQKEKKSLGVQLAQDGHVRLTLACQLKFMALENPASLSSHS